MCLYLDRARSKVEYATRDIVVYKRLLKVGEFLRAPYQSFTYELGKTYSERFFTTEVPSKGGRSRKDFSFRTRLPKAAMVINRGFHSYTRKPESDGDTVIVKCIVPKGTLFIRDYGGEIVSLKIRPIKIVRGKWLF